MTRRPVDTASPWHTPDEASGYTRRSLDIIYRALKSGELIGYRRGNSGTWLIHVEDLDAWIKGEAPGRRRAS